jgi:hypothetical protein
MTELFHEARLKIERAKEHINHLNLIARDFAETKSHEAFIEHDPEGGDDLLKVRAGLLPTDFALVLGDAAHNLIAALDYTINEIEFRTRGFRSKYTKFPMYDTRNALIGAVGGGFKEKAPKQVIECIVDVIQPYLGGHNAILYCLHTIELEDKHRLLIPKLELKFVDGIVIENDGGVEIPISTWLIVDEKIASQPIKDCRNAKVKNHGKALVKIMFTDVAIKGLGVSPLILTMELMTRRTEETIAEIEYRFRRSQI